jgi:hypothetical protein
MNGNLVLAVFLPKPCSTNSASIMQGAQNHIVGDQMMFGIFFTASAFVFVLGVSSWVRQKFLPTGELGTFFHLAVCIYIYGNHLKLWFNKLNWWQFFRPAR